MKKKLMAVITAAVLFLANNSVVFADVEVNKDKLQELEQKVSQLENEIFSLNDDIAAVKENLNDNNKEIKGIDEQLIDTEEDIKESEEDLKDKQALYDLKMRQLYKENGQLSYLSLLFESKSLGDLISKASLVSQLLRFDYQIINDFQEGKNKLLELVEELNNKAARAESLKRDNEEKLKSLEEKRSAQRKLLKEINSDMEALRILIEEEENYIASQAIVQEKNEIIIDAFAPIEANEEEKNDGQASLEGASEEKNDEQPPKEDDSKEESSDKVDDSLTSLGVFKLTGYCNCVKCCGSHSGGTTVTGTIPKANHTIAVDPTVIPYRTVVIINGEDYVAEDCGGGVKKYHIDIYFDTHEEALAFGAQYAEVFIKK